MTPHTFQLFSVRDVLMAPTKVIQCLTAILLWRAHSDNSRETLVKKLILAAVLASALMTFGLKEHALNAQGEPHEIDITAKRFNYAPAEITLKKGQPVVLAITSADTSHGLKITELNVNAHIPKGGTTRVNVTPDETGDFVGHCSVFCGSGHGGMMLTVHVVD